MFLASKYLILMCILLIGLKINQDFLYGIKNLNEIDLTELVGITNKLT